MKRLRNRCLITLTAALLCSCAGSYKSTLGFNPSEPIRVVVLPFYQVDSHGGIRDEGGKLLIDQVSLVSDEVEESPQVFLRKLTQNELGKTNLDLVSPALIDSRLSHTGYVKPDLSFDLTKIMNVAPQDICPKVLDCDAVLYGKVTEWDRSYYGIQSVSSVGLDLKLVSTRSGEVLFETRASDSESRGITKGPTGFSDLLIEPIRGLNSEIISDLARGMVRKMLSPLYMTNRPEFLESPPPSIFASAHDAPEGNIGQALTVLMLGNVGMTATFSIGNQVQHRPMSEREPGHYIGVYYPLETDSFTDQPVTVYLADQFSRTTQQVLGRQPVRIYR